jgi:hypothetical protein
MKLVHINWNPTDRQLRQFGLISLFALPLLGLLWRANPTLLGLLTLAGAVLWALSMLRPRVVKPVFLALSIAAIPIGMVVGELAMLVIYFGVFLPIGLLFRLLGRDSLQLGDQRRTAVAGYWQPKAQPRGPASYYRQS